MRTLIISDIHANRTALEAVLADAVPYDRVWCLGDLVGYGPDPNEVIEIVRDLPNLACIKGNHDAAILDEIDSRAFNHEAQASLDWLATHLRGENRKWLADLAERIEFEDFTLVHGSPRNPVWEYVMDLSIARANMIAFDTQVCLVGHTHIPVIFAEEGADPDLTRLFVAQPGEPFGVTQKSIINPGSVGQPRDHDPRASYLLYDADLEAPWCYRRVAYDIEQVQRRILDAGLPVRHATRLAEGW